MRFPSVLELRWFKSLSEQPVLLDLGATADPSLPKLLPAAYDSFGFAGSKLKLLGSNFYFSAFPLLPRMFFQLASGLPAARFCN
jgi:hypothetical protein